jgi:hypothetical protein
LLKGHPGPAGGVGHNAWSKVTSGIELWSLHGRERRGRECVCV